MEQPKIVNGNETWKPWSECEKYWVSSNGRVYSAKSNTILKQRIGGDKRYLVVDLCCGNKRWCKRVHRLVAEVFVPNPQKLKEVNHIDGNKLNNEVSNLEWCTHLDNMRHAEKNRLVKHPHRFTKEQIDYIRTHYIPYDERFGTRGLARKFNVNHTQIRYVLNRRFADEY